MSSSVIPEPIASDPSVAMATAPEAIPSIPEGNEAHRIREIVGRSVACYRHAFFVKSIPAGFEYHTGQDKTLGYTKWDKADQVRVSFITFFDADGKESNPFLLVEAPWNTYLAAYSMNGSLDSFKEIMRAKGYEEANLTNLL